MSDQLQQLLSSVVDPNRDIDVPALTDKVSRMLGSYTLLEVEAALCVWEHLIELTEFPGTQKPAWAKLRGEIGSVEMRHQSIVLGKWCLKVYDLCTKYHKNVFDGLPYDWEVIPMILGYAEDNEGNPAIYEEKLPAPDKVALLVLHRQLRNEFVDLCRQESKRQWKYEDLVSDHKERVDQAFELGEDPADFIKWLGEKYDLITF